jgi:membrane-bound lytic murein transglycosylase D
MNLNLKAATTAACIATLLPFLGPSRSIASSVEGENANPDRPSVSSSTAVAPIAAAIQTNPSVESNDLRSDGTVTMPVISGPTDAETAAVSIDLTPDTDALTVGDPRKTLLTSSPFIHSEPHPIVPFPLLLNRSVQNYVKDFLNQPQGLELAFQRSRPFMPEMFKVMKVQGIPDDLVYLSFAESGFSKRGKGPWQFTASTAARFGLRVNKWLDERRDPILSTKAAAEYLAELHDQADNDWRVALIGWNTGEGNLERYWLLEGANYNKFADRLPHRTRQLLSRFMAVAFIAHNSAAYGLGNVSYADSPAWSMRKFKGGTLLSSIALEFETTVAKLRELNPALRADRVPPTERAYGVRIPILDDASY